MVEIFPMRPASRRNSGHRVIVHDFVRVWLVVHWQGRSVASQRQFTTKEAAEAQARRLARQHRCSLILHSFDVRA